MDWDAAYSNVDHIADSAAYPPKFAAEAQAFRDSMGARTRRDIAYGQGSREVLDLFLPEDAPQGLAVFVHGGYWRRFSGKDFSHMAAGALTHGWAVAVPSYTLCPQVRIAHITRQVGAAIARAAEEIAGPIRLAGHSAGGHLAARMLCADTPLPIDVTDRIAHTVSISGVHDLRPLLRTEINADLRMGTEEAWAESPALLAPLEGARISCWVGAAELPEFVRQSALLANIWTGLGAHTASIEATGKHHLNVIEDLTNPGSALTGLWLD